MLSLIVSILKLVAIFCMSVYKSLILPLLAALVFSSGAWGQSGHSYRDFKPDDCRRMKRSLDRQPDYVHLIPLVEGSSVYLVFNDSVWMERFFWQEKEDRWEKLLGMNRRKLGIKILSSQYFQCNPSGGTTLANYLWYSEPASWRDMTRTLQKGDGFFYFYLGELPPEFLNSPFDLGVIYSRKNRICDQHWLRRLPAHDWQIIPSPLLVDTLLFAGDTIPFPADTLPIVTLKQLSTTVIFPKDQTTFNRQQVQDFLRSLPLQHYQPLDVSIQAYASVEGPPERNIELYNQRAGVILEEVNRLLPQVEYFQCEVDENWEAFMQDIRQTPHAHLARLPRDTIRERLRNPILSQQLEPMLANHRKTILTITLRSEIVPATSTMQQMTDFFVQTLQNENLYSALRIQNAIFERIQNEDVRADFPRDLPIPENLDFFSVFNRQYLYQYHMGLADLRETWVLYDSLFDHYPDSPYLQYNLAELTFRRWYSGDPEISVGKLLVYFDLIEDKSEVPKAAWHRLRLNYNKTMAHNAQLERNISARNRHLNNIRGLYPEAQLSPEEITNLGGFLTAYGRLELAERMVRPLARAPQPDEEILFYYLNISISNDRLRSARWYRDLLEYTRLQYPERFCSLFTPLSLKGNGISALLDPILMEMYCKTCSEPLQSMQ